MPKKDLRVDAYIAKSADFARPVLTHLRKLVHANCPQVEETLKWGHPTFMHRGMMCIMAGFKEHCTFGFWKGKLIFESAGVAVDKDAMGHFGKITSPKDLPVEKVLAGYIRKAAQLNEAGVKKPAPPRPKARQELVVPDDLMAMLRKNKRARMTFENFSYSHRKEYLEWITEAKRPETRKKRMETTIAWLTEGKSRNWKYAGC